MLRSFENRLHNIWYGGSSLRFLLLPLTWVYFAVVACRRFLYASGLLRSRRVAVPVVIVGNITVGGTGKTPMTIWLAQQLAARGYTPGIISRGYRGTTGAQPQQATAGSDPAIVGDEAIMVANRSGCAVVVHADRVAAAWRAIELGATVIVSDDGLQHYRLGRNYEIAVVDGTRRYGNRHLLPAGPLREPVSRLDSVDQILIQMADDGNSEFLRRASDRPPVEFRLTAARICRLDNSATRRIGEFSGTRMHALAGIGHPERFFRLLEAHNIEVIRHPLPDHADIQPQDLEFGDDLDVVMTEKDAVKCRGFQAGNCWYVPVDVAMDDTQAADLLGRIVSKITPVDVDGTIDG